MGSCYAVKLQAFSLDPLTLLAFPESMAVYNPRYTQCDCKALRMLPNLANIKVVGKDKHSFFPQNP